MKNIFLILLISFVFYYSGFSCKDSSNNRTSGVASLVIVTFIAGKNVFVLREGKKKSLKVKDILKVRDVIITDDKSFATLQMGKNIIFKISSGTKLKLSKLFEKGATNLDLRKGSVSAKVRKLSKNQDFSISTLSCLAAVRGTLFSISYTNSQTKIPLLQGKLHITTKIGKKDIALNKGKTAVIFDASSVKKEKIKILAISIKDKSKLKTIENISIDKDILKKSSEEIKNRIQNTINKAKTLLNNKPSYKSKANFVPKSIQEIKTIFKQIDKITLYSGKVIRGAIINRGKSYYTILIPGGKIQVKKTDIKKQEILK